ncbi:hydantoinase/oxoprolinase N-terminal domain-containing protein [Nonomuraea sp. NPDC059194]|uniref:hydantoinase/oxoprolinase N-terminal domain-containing protein n=1 Tax=Nonomuraea sp. NPDC059194 TaxID=3346764 RepID=UPI0036C8ADE1
MRYRLGVDVGGTFTDIHLIDQDTGRTFRAKAPSTPHDQSVGVLAGTEKIARSFVPGGLTGWIIWPKPEPLAALEDTVEAVERVADDGSVPVSPGDVLHFVTWGGGGWVDPLERDPELVGLEVRRGLVTVEGLPAPLPPVRA